MKAQVIFFYDSREPMEFHTYQDAYSWACEWNRNHPAATCIAVAVEKPSAEEQAEKDAQRWADAHEGYPQGGRYF